jgi:hypothetical protein
VPKKAKGVMYINPQSTCGSLESFPSSLSSYYSDMAQEIPKTMKAQVVQAEKVISIQDVPVPAIKDDELLVKVVAIALNPTDWKRTFTYDTLLDFVTFDKC